MFVGYKIVGNNPYSFSNFLFILDFKISAIDDYLRTHTRCGQLHCHPHIQELINLAIVNTIKICDISSLFVDNNEKRTKLNALYALQDSLSNAVALPVKPANRGGSSYTYCLPAQPDLSSASNEGDLHHLRNPVRPAVRISLDQSLVLQLEDILSQCQEGDSLWVMDQIEHVILTLPLPSDFEQQHPTYGAIVHNSEQFNRLQCILLQLQDVYNAKRHATVGNKQLASQAVVQMSFLALQDYFLRHHCAAESLPRFDAFFAQHSHHFFHGNRHSPYLASHHVATDHRFIELKKLYQNDSDNRTNQRMPPYRSDKISYINHYNALLRLHLALFQELGQRYIPPTDVKLNELLATNNARELYFFLEQFEAYGAIKEDSFLNEEQWNPLVETFRKQLVVERLVLNTLSPLYPLPFNLSIQPKLGKCPIDKSNFVFNTPLSIASIDFTHLSMQLIDHQYALEVSAEKKAFVDDTLMHLGSFARMNKVSSNVIQLSSHDESTKRVINKEDFFIRDLFHLRTSPTHQVNLTLDYFQSAHHHLVDENIQRYVEGNVFEPGLLMAVIHDDPTFLARFDRFIQTGIQAFVTVNNEMTQEALFFIRLNMLVSRYAAEADDGQKDRLQKEHQRINDLLMTNRDPSLLSSLHQYRFLTLIVLHRDDVLNDELFKQALTSYFHIQAKGNPHVRLDVETMHELQRAKRYFQDLIKQKTEIIDPDMIKDMIRPLNPDFSLLALS